MFAGALLKCGLVWVSASRLPLEVEHTVIMHRHIFSVQLLVWASDFIFFSLKAANRAKF